MEPRLMDTESRGWVRVDDLVDFGQYTGNRHWNANHVMSLLKVIDEDHDGKVTLDDFQQVCFEETSHHPSWKFKAMVQGFIDMKRMPVDRRKHIEEVYRVIDYNANGVIDRENMMDFGQFMNDNFDEARLSRLMDQIDLDGDGLVSAEEFLAYFAKLTKSVDDRGFSKGVKRYLQYQPTKRKS